MISMRLGWLTEPTFPRRIQFAQDPGPRVIVNARIVVISVESL
jgi:hypothetical protein